MAFDSNGNWSSDFYPITDRDNSVPILASKFQTLIQSNLKQSFENCILRDGTGKPTANINWNSQKITNLADGTNNGDAINKGQLDNALAVSAGEEQQGTVELSTQAEALAGTDDTTAMTPAKVKAVFDTLTTTTRFCINSAPGGSNIAYKSATGILDFLPGPIVGTKADGTSFTVQEIDAIDISGYADGTYNVFLSPAGAAYVYPNKIYRQQSQPVSMNTNDIWLNTMEPFKSFIKTADGLVETDIVPLNVKVVIRSGDILRIDKISYFNDNFVNNDISSYFGKITDAIAPNYGVYIPLTSGTAHLMDAPGWLIMFYNMRNIPDDTIYPSVVVNGSLVTYFRGEGHLTLFFKKGDSVTLNYSQASWYQIRPYIAYCNGISGVTI